MRRPILMVALGALLLVALIVPGAGAAKNSDFIAPMSHAQEVDKINAPGAGGMATYWVEGNVLHYEISVRKLTGPTIMAHIHGPADRGANAGISIWLCGTAAAPGPAGTPTCSSTTDGLLVAGSVTVTAEQLAMLEAGLGYTNVHTAMHGSGEVRGQVLPVGSD